MIGIGRKKSPDGVPMLFLTDLVGYQGDDCVIWPFAKKKAGYGNIRVNGKYAVASRIMCEIAHGRAPSETHECAHTCGQGNAGCVNPRHLTWSTPAANQRDRVRDGTHNRGDMRRKGTKLTEEVVRDMRRAHAAGKSMYAIAKERGINQITAADAIRRRTWGWLT